MIILEGPDGAGKTTLAGKLVKEFGLKMLPRAATSLGGPVDDLAEWTVRELSTWPKPGIYDRFPLFSDPIYGPLVRGYLTEGFDNPDWYQTELNWLLSHNPAIIYCMPNIATCMSNLQDEDQMPGVIENFVPIWLMYQHQANLLASHSNLPVLVWDYNQPFAKVAQFIDQYLRAHPNRRPIR